MEGGEDEGAKGGDNFGAFRTGKGYLMVGGTGGQGYRICTGKFGRRILHSS